MHFIQPTALDENLMSGVRGKILLMFFLTLSSLHCKVYTMKNTIILVNLHKDPWEAYLQKPNENVFQSSFTYISHIFLAPKQLASLKLRTIYKMHALMRG